VENKKVNSENVGEWYALQCLGKLILDDLMKNAKHS
jgi:hypothetical protein